MFHYSAWPAYTNAGNHKTERNGQHQGLLIYDQRVGCGKSVVTGCKGPLVVMPMYYHTSMKYGSDVSIKYDISNYLVTFGYESEIKKAAKKLTINSVSLFINYFESDLCNKVFFIYLCNKELGRVQHYRKRK